MMKLMKGIQGLLCMRNTYRRASSVLVYQTCIRSLHASALDKSGSYGLHRGERRWLVQFGNDCHMLWIQRISGLATCPTKIDKSLLPHSNDSTKSKSFVTITNGSSDDVGTRKKDGGISEKNAKDPPSGERRRLVIFDKDGTIICVHKMWGRWLKEYAARLEDATGLVLAEKILEVVGFDNEAGKFLPGGFAEGTTSETQEKIIQCISQDGIPREDAEMIMYECWHTQARERGHDHGDIHPLGDVGALFRDLKSKGYLIAVNTSDNRGVTEFTLDHLNLRQYVDMIVCGDDEGVLPKPHPWTAQKICSELQVKPSDVIMIGDSPSDMRLGCNAGFRCSIGVLTGITSREVLEQDATHVVDDIHHALGIILQDSHQ